MRTTPRSSRQVPIWQKAIGVIVILAVFASYAWLRWEAVQRSKRSADADNAKATAPVEP